MTSSDEEFRAVAYGRYGEDIALDFKRYERAYRRIIDGRLNILPTWRCLDIACGSGNFLSYLRGQSVSSYLGVDSSEGAIGRAVREFGVEHATVGDVFDVLGKARSEFELVSALDFVEHLNRSELRSLLGLVFGSLSPGGFFLLRTPNAGAPFGMSSRYNDVTHELCFTPPALADLLKRYGFEVVDLWEDVGRPKTLAQSVQWVAWQIVRALYRILDGIETGSFDNGLMTRNFWLLVRRPAN